MTKVVRFLDEGEENAGDMYRVTPHPNKKLRRTLENNDDDDDTSPDDTTMNESTNETSNNAHGNFEKGSDDGEKEKNDGTQGTEDKENVLPDDAGDDPNASDEDEWNQVVEQIQQEDRDSASVKNLQAFQQGLSIRESSQARLAKAYEEGAQSLTTLNQRVVEQLAMPLYKRQHERMEVLGKDIVHYMVQNHERRNKLVNKLQDQKNKIDMACNNLMSTILQEPLPHPDEQAHESTMIDKNENSIDTTSTAETQDKDSEHDPEDDTIVEPNWTEMAESYEPSGKRIQLFLEGRDILMTAEERFTAAMEEIRNNLKDCEERFEFLITEAYEQLTVPLDEQQADIQRYMTSNVKRRQQFERAIHEQAKQAQGVFARLMTSVRSCQPLTPVLRVFKKRPSKGSNN